MENLLPAAVSLAENHGTTGAILLTVYMVIPRITAAVVEILPLVSERANKRAIRLAKVNSQKK
ncbi:hypothetical protein [Nocardia sp. R7R-8]|uniref:hypothetical protein n=1 Tax=Nocardia sp. R7R-8 TaxID=3459304 RepID=UPI00403E1355